MSNSSDLRKEERDRNSAADFVAPGDGSPPFSKRIEISFLLSTNHSRKPQHSVQQGKTRKNETLRHFLSGALLYFLSFSFLEEVQHHPLF